MNESVDLYYSFINCLLRQTFDCRYANNVKNHKTGFELNSILEKLNDEERGLLADYVFKTYKGGVLDVLMNLELMDEHAIMKGRIKNTEIPAGTFTGMARDYFKHCQSETWIIDIDGIKKQLSELISVYDVDIDTLSAYLELPAEQVRSLSLPEEPIHDFSVFDKIKFLYTSVTDRKNRRLRNLLQKLLSKDKLSRQEITAMAGVEIGDIEKILSNDSEEIPVTVKYKVAVTVYGISRSVGFI